MLGGKYFPGIYESHTLSSKDWKCSLGFKSMMKSREQICLQVWDVGYMLCYSSVINDGIRKEGNWSAGYAGEVE